MRLPRVHRRHERVDRLRFTVRRLDGELLFQQDLVSTDDVAAVSSEHLMALIETGGGTVEVEDPDGIIGPPGVVLSRSTVLPTGAVEVWEHPILEETRP